MTPARMANWIQVGKHLLLSEKHWNKTITQKINIDSKLEYHSLPLYEIALSFRGKYNLNTGLSYKILDIQSSTCIHAVK